MVVTACNWALCEDEAAGPPPVPDHPYCPRHMARHLRVLRAYGVPLWMLDTLIRYQEFRCPVCSRSLADDGWVVDHDHRKGGTVRGILCRACNHRVVGRHTNGDLLISAGKYLNSPPAARLFPGTLPAVPPKRRKRKKAAPKK